MIVTICLTAALQNFLTYLLTELTYLLTYTRKRIEKNRKTWHNDTGNLVSLLAGFIVLWGFRQVRCTSLLRFSRHTLSTTRTWSTWWSIGPASRSNINTSQVFAAVSAWPCCWSWQIGCASLDNTSGRLSSLWGNILADNFSYGLCSRFVCGFVAARCGSMSTLPPGRLDAGRDSLSPLTVTCRVCGEV